MSQQRHIIRHEIKELVLLAGPVVAAQLGQISNGFVDTVMVGRLGSAELAGVALGNTTFFFLLIVCMGVVVAVGPMVSQAFGAGEHDPIGRSVRQGLWLGVALTVPAFLILWNIAPFWRMIGQVEETVVIAQQYLRAIVWGFLPFLWFVALRSFVEAVSRPWPVTFITFVGVGLNIGANYVLMFGKLGFPAMGLVGTGWASTFVFWFLFLALAGYVQGLPRFRTYRLFARLGKPDPHYFREIFRIGWPIGVSYGIEAGLFMMTAFMIGTLGAVPLAAHQVAIQCAAFTFMVPLGIGIATSVRVGQAVGRGDPVGARWAGYLGVLLAGVFMLCAAILFWTVPESIISLYLDLDNPANADVVRLAVTLLGVAAVFQIFDGVQVAAAGGLRGLKDTRVPMVLAFVSYWILGLSIGYLLGFVGGWGARGLWWGLVVGLASASVLLTGRFHRHVGYVPSGEAGASVIAAGETDGVLDDRAGQEAVEMRSPSPSDTRGDRDVLAEK
ncbi:MAG: MATE family efflux transporter [Rhodothermales bacterium]